MKLRKFRAATTKDALAMARRELGEDAILLHQRTLPGDPETGSLSQVEVTVAVDVPDSPHFEQNRQEIRPFFEDGRSKRSGSGSESSGRILSRAVRASAERSGTGVSHPSALESTDASGEIQRQSGAEYDAIWREIRHIRSLLQRQSQNSTAAEPLRAWRASLQESLLPQPLIDDLLLGLDDVLTAPALERTEVVTATLSQRLLELLPPVQGEIKSGEPGNPLIFVIVGPTGVGKTTTLAKLAARYSIPGSHGARLPVALITADTFRVGAVSQLRTYSDLIRAPLEVAYTPQELQEQVANHRDKSIIFVDTPGRSPNDTEQLEVMRSFVSVLPDPHLQIAVAAGTMLADARRIVERFSIVPADGLLFTKLDETSLLGPACGLAAEMALPLSYFTNGQRVPEDIEQASKEKLVDQLMKGARRQVEAIRPVRQTTEAAAPTENRTLAERGRRTAMSADETVPGVTLSQSQMQSAYQQARRAY